jgi:hypothetical protein
MSHISIPSAKRLISSMRDLGYEFSDAVAEIVDNSIQAGANVIQVSLQFDGYESYLTVLDNGVGMTPAEMREALRFGSMRDYEQDDLGKFGLGLKTSSLSQCDALTVSSRNSQKKVQIHSYSWDMDHINKVDQWEILPIETEELLNPVVKHLYSTTGTAVTWERLNRLLNFQDPTGGRAENDFKRLILELKITLGAIFHRYLTGEQRSKKVMIFVNGDLVESWDPFCRAEKKTVELDSFSVPISMDGNKSTVKFRPFVLPTQSQFSSSSAHLRAGGPAKWNKQQGFYIYRSGRLLQSGGWCGLRTSDEHSKLARVMVEIPAGFDDLFKVNISKMKINFPREMREEVIHKLAPTLKKANDSYRTQGETSFSGVSVYETDDKHFEKLVGNFLSKLDADWNLSPGTAKDVFPKLYGQATPSERRYLLRIFKRLAGGSLSEQSLVELG